MKPNDLRCVLVELVSAENSNAHQWWKVSLTSARESISDTMAAVTWLEAHDYHQAGAMLGQDRRLAVFWLKEDDQPEYLESVLGERVVPVTCAWSFTENRIVTTRTAAQIQRQRQRITARGDVDSRDLQFVELPTLAATMKLYGLS